MALKINQLVKRYGDRLILDFLDLEVQDGELFGLLGSDGAGKSTVIDCILGLQEYDRGEITIFSETMGKNHLDLKRRIGIVPEQLVLIQELTVYENIDFFCGLYISDHAVRKQYVDEAITLCDLCTVLALYPRDISPGVCKRLNFACGIAHKPDFLIVDEPIIGSDALSRAVLIEAIKQLNRKGTTIFYASRDIEEMSQLCSRIAIMNQGKVIITATTDELKAFISVGEKVTIEVYKMSPEYVEEISGLRGVAFTNYVNHELVVRSEKGRNNLANILHFLEDRKIPFGKVYSEVPMLKDVFWELTGKEL